MDGAAGREDIEMNPVAFSSSVPRREQLDKYDEAQFEEDSPSVVFGPATKQRRREWEFKRRHIEFMTLGYSLCKRDDLSPGAVMGIGIFLRSADALFLGGPIAMILAYICVGSVAYAVTVVP